MDFNLEHEERCKIAEKLESIHDWAHTILKTLDKQELLRAHDIGHKILDLLNEQQAINAVKFLAVFEALGVGADVMEHDADALIAKTMSSTATIN